MLKISVQHSPGIATMKVEGKIVGPWASELEHVWRDLWIPIQQKQLRLDLREVTFVDKEGMQVLREIIGTTGAEILTDSPLSQYFAEQAKRGVKPQPEKEN